MAKNKRPFSSFLENPDTNKAVQEALHAPAQLPTQEAPAPVAVSAPVQQSAPVAEPVENGREKKVESEPYQVVTIRKSVHRLLKMASVHYDIEIRELATEAIAAHPKIKEMLEKYG